MPKMLITGGPDQGKEFLLDELGEGPHIAGRDPRHTIAVADSTVSREHFRLERLPRGFRVVDLGSRNRTFINGEPVRAGVLRNGDVITIGDSELCFEDDAGDVEVAEMNSTIIKEYSAVQRSSIERIIDSLRDAPELRRERIQRAVESLRQLFDLSRKMLASASVEDLYQRFLEILVPAIEADRGVVMTRDGDVWSSAALYLAAPRSEDETVGAGKRDDPAIQVDAEIINRVADGKKAVLSSSTRSATATAERRTDGDTAAATQIASAVAAPIRLAGRTSDADVHLVLYADRRTGRTPFTDDELHLLSAAAEQAGGVIHHLESSCELREANHNLIRSISNSRPIIGESTAVSDIDAFIRKAAPTSMTVLIRGETGTGKDLVASAIHYESPRRGRPFVSINCAALPENLLESELFGYEKGAFTGATSRKKGRFELADTGTVFLDEIAELSPGCQAKVLRLLEERRFERVGGTRSIAVDVRIIAATNKDLGKAIEDGTFREDLFYRLNVLEMSLAPLRERPEDIPLLVRYFLEEAGYPTDGVLSPAAEQKLQSYAWPGNVRQLRNVVESAMVLGDGPTIQAADLMLPDRPARPAASEAWSPESLDDVQRRHVLRVLEFTGGNKKRAAEILGIERCTLYSRLRSYGIGVKESSTKTK